MRVLVVDESPRDRQRVAAAILGAAPAAAVVEVPDGVAALRRLARERFDLVITDLVMPRSPVHGIDVLDVARNLGVEAWVATAYPGLAPPRAPAVAKSDLDAGLARLLERRGRRRRPRRGRMLLGRLLLAVLSLLAVGLVGSGGCKRPLARGEVGEGSR